jgi:peroxiredoxin
MKTLIALGFSAVLAAPPAAPQRSVSGMWDATVTVNGADIPFRLEIAGEGTTLRGSFFNGDEKVTSTRGRLDGEAVTLEFDDYATRLEATFKDDRLEGRYDRGPRGFYPFQAKRFAAPVASAERIPSIAGVWRVPYQSAKGESAWQLIVRQSGAEASAAILRVDGDTGTLTGTYKNGSFVLSHFSGARPSLFEVTPQPDGTLTIVQKALSTKAAPNPKTGRIAPSDSVSPDGKRTYTATRSDDPRAANLPQPSDPTRFTSVKDPSEPLRFSFPDVQGHLVSNTDARFRGKVLLVNITGSWCPNCHDEAPFLVELYRTYHARGLEIVGLSFEESEQLENLSRLRAFIDLYHVTYPVLVAGTPDDLTDKLPQATNLSSFPTTFFIGRDGLVRGAHAGFPGKASAKFHTEAKKEITERVEQLLAERVQESK